ncbi:SGNH/GDSL hydrolase family protein [Brevibacterium sp. 5221]|uniref:SGNH/GDSL hydrolase family protein n=1 Tax=Brevibacterium rongguiense TaxID=2695267 RepID=A0A6N9HA80_9MICO|nr:SGNH/GDSL hydrolase family protein [Brevibacterium rongguiense]MYM20929.1 SGNH/GDSL hydrolase family protein [Brevibacterium rongguiense]
MSGAPGPRPRAPHRPRASHRPQPARRYRPAASWAAALGGVALGAGLGYAASVARVQIQSRLFPRYWELVAHPPQAAPAEAPIAMSVLGDSAAAGVGANDPQSGYVGLLAARLAAATGREVRVSNVAVPGASSWLLMEHQLPLFERLPEADLVLCIIGANDIADRRFTLEGFVWTAERLYPRLPAGTVVATIPSFGLPWLERKVRAANAVIVRLAREHDLELADLYTATRRLWPFAYLLHQGGDFFHPNERGYRVWADAIWPALERAWARRERPTQPAAGAPEARG